MWGSNITTPLLPDQPVAKTPLDGTAPVGTMTSRTHAQPQSLFKPLRRIFGADHTDRSPLRRVFVRKSVPWRVVFGWREATSKGDHHDGATVLAGCHRNGRIADRNNPCCRCGALHSIATLEPHDGQVWLPPSLASSLVRPVHPQSGHCVQSWFDMAGYNNSRPAPCKWVPMNNVRKRIFRGIERSSGTKLRILPDVGS